MYKQQRGSMSKVRKGCLGWGISVCAIRGIDFKMGTKVRNVCWRSHGVLREVLARYHQHIGQITNSCPHLQGKFHQQSSHAPSQRWDLQPCAAYKIREGLPDEFCVGGGSIKKIPWKAKGRQSLIIIFQREMAEQTSEILTNGFNRWPESEQIGLGSSKCNTIVSGWLEWSSKIVSFVLLYPEIHCKIIENCQTH